VSDVPDPDDFEEPVEFDDEVTPLERTRAEYTGVDLEDEFQPVDEVELAEDGLLLDDPERLSEGRSATGGEDLDPDDVGWDLDEDD
jgi:hypothetical protein